jgi:hypothetical protein
MTVVTGVGGEVSTTLGLTNTMPFDFHRYPYQIPSHQCPNRLKRADGVAGDTVITNPLDEFHDDSFPP